MTLFKRFQASWPKMNQCTFSASYSDPAAKQALKAASHSVIATQQFVTSLLERNDQPHKDYKEFLELVAIFLGGTPAGGIRFRAPGATSEALDLEIAEDLDVPETVRSSADRRASSSRRISVCLFLIREKLVPSFRHHRSTNQRNRFPQRHMRVQTHQ